MEQPQSSEDIVQALRDMAFIIDESQGAAVVAMLSGSMFDEAADDIERLREELNTTQELLARCYKLAVGNGPNFNVFDDWEEAIAAYEREATSRTIRYDGIPAITSEQVDQILKAIRETHRG